MAISHQLKSHAPYLVTRVAALVREAIVPVLREHDITLPMWRTLASLYDDGAQSVGDLLIATSLEQSTLSRTISALERRGFVSKKSNAGENRTIVIGLLARGRRMTERLLPQFSDAHESLVAGVRADDLAVFTRVLARLHSNISASSDTPTAKMRQRALTKRGAPSILTGVGKARAHG